MNYAPKPNKAGDLKINIGADAKGVKEARGAINDILGAAVENQTKVEALRALTAMTRIEAVTIRDSSFDSSYHEAEPYPRAVSSYGGDSPVPPLYELGA